MNYVLVIIYMSTGGLGNILKVEIESIDFNTKIACEVVLSDMGEYFSRNFSGKCYPKGDP